MKSQNYLNLSILLSKNINLKLILKKLGKNHCLCFPLLNWQKMFTRKKNSNNQYDHFFSTSYIFNNINYRLRKMNNYTTLKKNHNILFILLFLIL